VQLVDGPPSHVSVLLAPIVMLAGLRLTETGADGGGGGTPEGSSGCPHA
jgi:hypothetical protein